MKTRIGAALLLFAVLQSSSGCLDFQERGQNRDDELRRNVGMILSNSIPLNGSPACGKKGMDRTRNNYADYRDFPAGRLSANPADEDGITEFIRTSHELGIDSIAASIFIKANAPSFIHRHFR